MPLKRSFLASLALLGCLFVTAPVYAQTSPSTEGQPGYAQTTPVAEGPSDNAPTTSAPEGKNAFLPDYADIADKGQHSGPGFLDVTLKLLFVLGLIAATAALYKRYGKPMPTFGGEEAIRLWATRSLSLGADLHLIEVGDRMLLVGKSGTGMATLSEFTDPAVIADLKSHCIGPMALPGGGGLWERILRREGGR